MLSAEHRLLVYGSLAPGKEHADVLAHLDGHWCPACTRGHIDRTGRYPIYHPEPDGPWEQMTLFESVSLPLHWPRIDAFEGRGYQRIIVTAHTPKGELEAYIYAAAPA